MGWLSTSETATDIFMNEMKSILINRLADGGGVRRLYMPDQTRLTPYERIEAGRMGMKKGN